jgi:hypothetical protein
VAAYQRLLKAKIGRHMARHNIDVKGWLSVRDGNFLKKQGPKKHW